MKWFWRCQAKQLQGFYYFGKFVAQHPLWFIIVPLVVCSALAYQFKDREVESGAEALYTVSDSRAKEEREVARKVFGSPAVNFYRLSSPLSLPEEFVIFRSKENQAIFKDEVIEELQNVYQSILAMKVRHKGNVLTYRNVCAKTHGQCTESGASLLTPHFRKALKAGLVTYPLWTVNDEMTDLSRFLGNVETINGTVLVSAGSIQISFPLTYSTSFWTDKLHQLLENLKLRTVDVAFGSFHSLSNELENGTAADIKLFIFALILTIVFASVVSSGGDCVSTRALLSVAGIVATLLGIVASLGLVVLAEVKFTPIVGIMPFLMLGIGVDDMFLLMNSWSETTSLTGLTIPERIGTAYKRAGIGMTITSVTNCLAFVIGNTSIFLAVRIFCANAAVAVVLCYICNVTFFGASLTLHGHRVYSNRHTVTCMEVDKSRSEMRQEGRSLCYAFMCGGTYPKQTSDDQSVCEKGPRMILIKFLLWTPAKIFILLFFALYLALAIWGCTTLRTGIDLKDLVLPSASFYKYKVWKDEDFGTRLVISFISNTTQNYSDPQTLRNYQDLIRKAEADSAIDPLVKNCWFLSLANSPFYDTSSEFNFYKGLQDFFRSQPKFSHDVSLHIDDSDDLVIQSKCQVYTYRLDNSNDKAGVMMRMREIADNSPAKVFAYNGRFVIYEQYAVIGQATLKTIGGAIAMMFVVTSIFIPHPLMVLLVFIEVIMINIGILGFMSHWGLTICSITMVHLIMSAGFSIDFCAHICSAYMVSEETSRENRIKDAIVHAAGPIFNSGMASFVGVLALLLTESFVFRSFFKVMSLVLVLGILHAVFLMPVLLSFFGPYTHSVVEDSNLNESATPKISSDRDSVEETTPQNSERGGSPSIGNKVVPVTNKADARDLERDEAGHEVPNKVEGTDVDTGSQ